MFFVLIISRFQSSIHSHVNSKSPEVDDPPSNFARGSVPNTHEDLNAGIGTAEMLGRYNYLALVGGGKNPRWPQTKVRL